MGLGREDVSLNPDLEQGLSRGLQRGLQASGLTLTRGGRRIVDGVDLSVRPGEIVGLLGPNGAGKTSCFRMLTGIWQPDGGQIALDGQLLTGLPLWRRVRRGLGYLPQEPSVLRHLTVRKNLCVPLEARGAPVSDADALLSTLSLEGLADARAGTLSGGERRRLEIGRCLAAAPRILLLDEPFSGVDPVSVADLQDRIRRLASSGIGVLITDHAVHEALALCDRALILDGGRVMVQGSPAEVAADPHARARYLGVGFILR